MEVFTLNVGQGNFVVFRQGQEAFLVDSHIPTRGDSNTVFVKNALAKLLAEHKLVGVVLTSFDADHADPRGLAWVLGRYWPHWIMYPKYWKGTETADDVMETITALERERRGSARSLQRISVRLDKVQERVFPELASELSFEVFSPHPEDMTNSNNCSLVVKVASKDWFSGGFRYLVTGDTENRRWESINRIFGAQLGADVLAAPHHGSANGINEETLEHVGPNTVLVSAGAGNQFGHPHKDALNLYEQAGAKVYSTHMGTSFRTYRGFWGVETEVWSA